MPNLRKNSKQNDLIHICHEKCVKNDSEVFIFRKSKCPQNIFEVELKHPKCKVYTNHIPATKETQIDELELQAAFEDICGAAKPKKPKK